MRPLVGIVGRFVEVTVRRGEVDAVEACEVMACQYSGGGMSCYWSILVATHDGTLISFGPERVKLAPQPTGEGPYR